MSDPMGRDLEDIGLGEETEPENEEMEGPGKNFVSDEEHQAAHDSVVRTIKDSQVLDIHGLARAIVVGLWDWAKTPEKHHASIIVELAKELLDESAEPLEIRNKASYEEQGRFELSRERMQRLQHGADEGGY